MLDHRRCGGGYWIGLMLAWFVGCAGQQSITWTTTPTTALSDPFSRCLQEVSVLGYRPVQVDREQGLIVAEMQTLDPVVRSIDVLKGRSIDVLTIAITPRLVRVTAATYTEAFIDLERTECDPSLSAVTDARQIAGLFGDDAAVP